MAAIFDLLELKDELTSYLSSNYENFGTPTFSISEDGSTLSFTFDLTLEGIDDAILFEVSVSDNGSTICRAFFDVLPKNEYTLNLINDFNCEVFFFKAYITKHDGFLVLENNFICLNIGEVKVTFSYFVNVLGALSFNDLFRKLTLITR